jgi:hypothetical protein
MIDAPAAPGHRSEAELATGAQEPRLIYEARRQAYGAEHAELLRWQNRLSNLRLLTAAIAIAAAFAAIVAPSLPAGVIAAVAAAVFVWLVIRHRAASDRRERVEVLGQINVEAIARLARDWDALPPAHLVDIPAGHPFAGDLDITGHGSLLQLLDTTATHAGGLRLAGWLTSLAPPVEAIQRQGAVQELEPLMPWRQELQMLGRRGGAERPDPEAFFAWAEGPRLLERHRALPWIARLGALATVAVIVLTVAGTIQPAFVAIPLLANLAIAQVAGRLIGDRIDVARAQHPALQAWAGLLGHLDMQEFRSPMLCQLLDELGAHDRPAHQEIARLGRITSFAVPRSALSHFPLQALGNWDIHVLQALERWQRDNGAHVRAWLETAGTFEALSALAGLAYDNPGWAFAEIDDAIDAIEARQLGHPLIPEGTRVCNDVAVGPAGKFLLVTGSNMSGKSTLLRSIGGGVVLASAGAPCCAASFRMPPVELWTSVRVTDSLEQGVSFYMAELLRLKAIHDAAREARAAGRPFVYLLDEILQGTNSAERQIAARHIIASLVDLSAIGAVSTHDLHLADAPELSASAVSVHFSDVFTDGPEGPAMTFDYQLRPGLATSTNALKLMEIVGFAVAPDGRSGLHAPAAARSPE